MEDQASEFHPEDPDMHTLARHPKSTRLFLLASFFLLCAPVHAASISKPGCAKGKAKELVMASNRNGAYVHPTAVPAFQCLLEGLERIKYPIRFVGGYGCRPLPTSNHPRGLAVDVNQSARDVTNPNVYRWNATAVAKACNLTHGAVWRKPDAGHFEIRSASRQQQAARRPARAAKKKREHFFAFLYR